MRHLSWIKKISRLVLCLGLLRVPMMAAGQADENLLNMPKWTSTAYYSIEANPPEERRASANSMEQEMKMLQHLLEDRFQLRTHWEQRERAGLALMLVTGKDTLLQPDKNGKCPRDGGVLPIEMLTTSLERILDQPVTNQTGLSGSYCIGLRWLSDDGTSQSLATASGQTSEKRDENSDVSLYTALQQQLGLMLKPQRAVVSILVVDSVQPPSPN
jgi:uncharacterized protein (TIGR03435 family)